MLDVSANGRTPVEEARRSIFQTVKPLAPIELPLAEASGCVVAADVTTEYDIPPFSSAAADGAAVRAADVVSASPDSPVLLRVAGWSRPGRPPEATVGWGEAVLCAAGAPLPAGADCVASGRAVGIEGSSVRVNLSVEPGANVRPAGEDVGAGSVLAPAGRRITGTELGILATAGYGTVLVYPKVRVGVLSLGDLVEPGRPTGFGQVRDANSYLLLGALRELGAVPYRIGIVRDVENELRETLASNLLRADAIVCSGVVTTRDGEGGLPTLLAGLGDVRTHRVAMEPGGTVVFGLVDGRPFFSFPPEPLGASIAFEVLARPAFLKMMGRRDVTRPEVTAVLDEAVAGEEGATAFVPASVAHRDGAWHAQPLGPPSPARLGAAARGNGLLMVPPDRGSITSGEHARVQIFRSLER
jgi:molybdopterin molybdotransferase